MIGPLKNSDTMRAHALEVTRYQCKHKLRRNAIGAIQIPMTCVKCNSKLKDGLEIDE